MLLILVLNFLFTSVQAAETTSTVTIPIKEYMDLKKISEKKSVTTLEEVQLSGEFGKNLQISFLGSSQGEPTFLPVLRDTGISLSNCQGQAALQVQDGSLQILAQSSKFKLSCQAAIKNWDQFQLIVLNALFVKSDVKGGDFQAGNGNIGERRITLTKTLPHRVVADLPITDEEPSAMGRYQISVLPEETKFRYILTFNNPNRAVKTFKLSFPNEEVVQKLETNVVYEEKEKAFLLKLPPGETAVVVTGRLPKPAFSSLVKTAVEYVLVENSPVLTLQIKEPSHRISVGDAHMSPQFLGARAYLLTKGDKVSWTSQKLEVFSALTFTVKTANYHYLWKEEGSNLVEAQFNIDNQGAAEIPLSLPGKPLYLEINGVPQVLAKNEEQQLLVRLPAGNSQNVTVQYEIEEKNKRGIASLSDDLARPSSVISRADLTLTMPKKKQLLFAESFHDKKFHYSMMGFLFALVGFLMAYKFFGSVSLSQRTSLASAAAVGVLIFLKGIFWPIFSVLVIALILHNRDKIKTPTTWQNWVKTVAITGFLIFAIPYVIQMFDSSGRENMISQLTGNEMLEGAGGNGFGDIAPAASMPQSNLKKAFDIRGSVSDKATENTYDEAPMEAEMDMAAAPSPVGQNSTLSTESYQGIPAKILLPHDGRQIHFRSELLDLNSPMEITAIAVSKNFFDFLFAGMILVLGLVFWKRRDEFVRYLKLNKVFKAENFRP